MSSVDPITVVRDFCASVVDLDLDHIVSFFTDDAVYHNIPLDPVVGPDAIRATLAGFTGGVDSIEFQLLAVAAAGNVVLTERVDVFNAPDRVISLPVMGAFEVTDAGKISAWRDYFDMNQFMAQLA